VVGALSLSSCGGADFNAEEGSAGRGGEPSAGANGGGRDNGAAGHVNEAGEAGDGGRAGEGGQAGQGNQGESGADSGGAPAGGTSNMTGGSGGSAQGGSAGSAGASATAIKAFDDFVVSAEGWSVTGDDTTKTVTYSSTGGKPNGSISAVEATSGTMFFTAPSKYLGDASAYYGGELRFDLKAAVTEGEFFAYADVELTSNQTTLAYDCTPNPTTAWQSYVVPLSETGWKMTTVTGAAVTAAQFKAVLANLTRVRIRGEFSNQYDIGYLDNVYFGSKASSAPGE
jgi:hypothetical protein